MSQGQIGSLSITTQSSGGSGQPVTGNWLTDAQLRASPVEVYFAEQIYTNIYRFNQVNAVASATETTVVSYTVPTGKTAALFMSQVSGDNIAEFRLYADSNLIHTQRTFFGDLNATMKFELRGYELTSGQVLSLKVIHNRPMLGSFTGNLQIKESI